MLEQFADDNVSFRSDCTVVREVLKPKAVLSPMIKSRIEELKSSDHTASGPDEEADRYVPESALSL